MSARGRPRARLLHGRQFPGLALAWLLGSVCPVRGDSDVSRHQLFFDVHNATQYYDFEFFQIPNYSGRTLLSDTVTPAITFLWNDRFRVQAGVTALRAYGSEKGYDRVDPHLQALWKPASRIEVIFGNLLIPHEYLAPLYFATNYIERRPVETGMQLIHHNDLMRNDAFFNYQKQDTTEHPERFDWGLVHQSRWDRWHLRYQFHWIHEGGQLNIHPVVTQNDVAQAVGGGYAHPLGPVEVGANGYFLWSHFRQEAVASSDTYKTNGEAWYTEAFVAWRKVTATAGYWRSFQFFHSEGHPVYSNIGEMTVLRLRWDILRSETFKIEADYTGYLLGGDKLAGERDIQSELFIEAVWKFSIPIVEWTTPAPGGNRSTRWDEGI